MVSFFVNHIFKPKNNFKFTTFSILIPENFISSLFYFFLAIQICFKAYTSGYIQNQILPEKNLFSSDSFLIYIQIIFWCFDVYYIHDFAKDLKITSIFAPLCGFCSLNILFNKFVFSLQSFKRNQVEWWKSGWDYQQALWKRIRVYSIFQMRSFNI